jgi:putative inorganic carbon (HCO3(-)) transporter
MPALLYALNKSATKAKLMWFALTSFWWTLLFVTGGRGTFVGLLAAFAVVLVLRRNHARAFLAAMGWTALAGLAIYGVMFVLPWTLGMEPWGDSRKSRSARPPIRHPAG